MKDFKLPKEPKIATGFQIPDGYFETFYSKLEINLPKQESKLLSFYTKNKSWLYSAAAILLVAFTLTISNFKVPDANTISEAEIENYIHTRSTIFQEEIVNELSQSDIEALKKQLLPNYNEDDILLETDNSNLNLDL